jgi:hypothetical protein
METAAIIQKIYNLPAFKRMLISDEINKVQEGI